MTDVDAYRTYVREFFVNTLTDGHHAEPEPDHEGGPQTLAQAKAWRAALYDAGLAGFGYPAESGGAGDSEVTRAHHVVFGEESRHRMPATESIFGIGISMALPMVRDHGSEAMRQRFLRPGLRGKEIWCQLYSEPNAGSDRRRSRPGRSATATSGLSPVRRCGRRVRNMPTWRFCWPGPTRRCQSTAVSPCSCSRCDSLG